MSAEKKKKTRDPTSSFSLSVKKSSRDIAFKVDVPDFVLPCCLESSKKYLYHAKSNKMQFFEMFKIC